MAPVGANKQAATRMTAKIEDFILCFFLQITNKEN